MAKLSNGDGASILDRASLALPWLLFILISLFILADQRRTGTTHFVDYSRMEWSMPPQTGEVSGPGAFDPHCGMEVRKRTSDSVVYKGKAYYFCSSFCRLKFMAAPAAYEGMDVKRSSHSMIGIPTWMYQVAIALILAVSFGLIERLPSGPRQGPRLDLTAFAGVRAALKWRPLLAVLRALSALLFLFVIAVGFYGNTDPERNLVPLFVWTVWWAGLIFFVLFMGEAWCAVCPWDTIAGWVGSLKSLLLGKTAGRRWPSGMRAIWPAVALFLLLSWLDEALWVTTRPDVTAWIAVAMVLMACACVLVFDRKVFCRYGCLVGRIIGVYSMFSPLEVRSNDQEVCASCKTMDCYKGNEHGDGCPTFLFPRALDVNTNCIMCAECFKSCPHDNMVLNLRPWGSDLTRNFKPRFDEAFLALILLSLSGFHGLAMTPGWRTAREALSRAAGMSETAAFTLMMLGMLFLPIGLYALLTRIASWASGKVPFKVLFSSYAYSLLPIALFYHLAHNAEHLLLEGPKLLPLFSDPFGRDWDLLGTTGADPMPIITLGGLWWIQVLLILTGHLYGLVISQRVTRRLVSDRVRAFRTQLPILLAMVSFSVFSLWLLKQPMLMRLSAM